MNDHWNRCRDSSLRRADELCDAVRQGRMNSSAFEGVMMSFLEQPAYYAEWREELYALCYERLHGFKPDRGQELEAT